MLVILMVVVVVMTTGQGCYCHHRLADRRCKYCSRSDEVGKSKHSHDANGTAGLLLGFGKLYHCPQQSLSNCMFRTSGLRA